MPVERETSRMGRGCRSDHEATGDRAGTLTVPDAPKKRAWLERSGQRLLETARLAGGMVVFKVGRAHSGCSGLRHSRPLAKLGTEVGQGMMADH